MMRSRRRALTCFMHAVLAAAVVAACASSGPRGATESAAREHNCGVEMVGDPPGPEYVEIARISLEGNADFGAGKYRDTRRYTTAVREMVCELGGEAVSTEMDAYGAVVRAIVYRRRPPPDAADPS
jgi:hypothetical protein